MKRWRGLVQKEWAHDEMEDLSSLLLINNLLCSGG